MQSEVTAGLDASGRVELFAVDAATHALKRIRQADDRGGWTDWLDLGAAVAPAPVVARNATGQLEIFAIDFQSKQLMHRWQAAPGKPDEWSVWTNLDETMLPRFCGRPEHGWAVGSRVGVDAELRTACSRVSNVGAARFGVVVLAEFGERNEAGDCIGAK